MDINAICRRWWGCIYDKYENGTDDVALLLDLIGPPPRNVFEVCCGTGRVLVPLAKAGHNVTGMDADEGMLARIPAKSEGLANLRYSQANALTADWGGGYDVVVLGDNTLMNLEHRDDDRAAQRLFIKKAADALKPGGHFFLAYDHYPEPEKIFIEKTRLSKGTTPGRTTRAYRGRSIIAAGFTTPLQESPCGTVTSN